MKNKSDLYVVRECVRRMSDDDAKFLSARFGQRFGGDLSDALSFIQDNHPELNKILASATSADGVYDIVDSIDRFVQEECKRRFSSKVAA